ncbi:extracellular solute-binding protein [Chelativorans sp. AA-79]|uniref:ABC transporter substrate-binding protein n=1 Tax=Chelativorans sp. AA-79 TaxID=3028735 RepID=UPI0023F76B2F|nr:extracellular solute-binding protein [Chelativorans sp. AA-79]WEX09136.1 extracellular solute-binding protein [Chelativorans sp. AA-79]
MKRISILPGFVAVALACAATISAHAQDKVTLVISNSQWLDALRGEALWNAVKAYEKQAPNVELKALGIPSKDYGDRLMTEIGAGAGPDVAIIQEGVFYALADAGRLVDVSTATEGVTMNVTKDNGIVGGQTLGVPWQRAAYALIYNGKITEAAGAKVPASVDELIASAKAVQEKSPGAIGFTSRHQISDFSGFYMDFQSWAYGYGVNWVDSAGELTINTPEAVAAVTAFKKVYDAEIIPTGDDMPTQRTRFKEGQVGYSIDNSGGTLNIASGGALKGSDIYAAPLPFPNPGAHQQIYAAVNANSEHPDEAIAFLKWLVSPEGQAQLRKASGPDMLATDVPLDPDFVKANPWGKIFADVATESRSVLIPGYEMETTQIMRPVMEAVEEVLISGIDPAAALAKAQERVDGMF